MAAASWWPAWLTGAPEDADRHEAVPDGEHKRVGTASHAAEITKECEQNKLRREKNREKLYAALAERKATLADETAIIMMQRAQARVETRRAPIVPKPAAKAKSSSKSRQATDLFSGKLPMRLTPRGGTPRERASTASTASSSAAANSLSNLTTRAAFNKMLKEDEKAQAAQAERVAKEERKRFAQEQKKQRQQRGASLREQEQQRVRDRLAALAEKKAAAEHSEVPNVLFLSNLSSAQRADVRKLLNSHVLPLHED